MKRMPTGWICRSRTDGAIAEEPPIVLQYDLVPIDVVLKDVAKLIGASPAGATVRVVTRLDSVRDALRQWSISAGVTLAHEDEFRMMADGRLFAQFLLDLQRASA
jgi:hypothetical protein